MFFKKQPNSDKYKIEEVSFPIWEALWAKISNVNLLQSWQYGKAKEQAEGWRAHRYVITDNNNRQIAITQLLIRTWPIVGGIARLNRGPLFLDDYPEEERLSVGVDIIKKLLNELRSKRCRVVQIAPELPYSENVKENLKRIGLRPINSTPWASAIMDLSKDNQKLLMQLNGKWRNCMRKGEKLGIIVKKVELNGHNLNLLFSSYSGLQQNRKFQGLSEKLISRLAEQTNELWSFNLFFAWDSENEFDNVPIGQLVSIQSGDTTMYLIGTTTDKGRETQANSVLLWQSIIHAKEVGCSWFDLGGLNTATPKGIAEFKKGLNATPYALIGEFRGYFII